MNNRKPLTPMNWRRPTRSDRAQMRRFAKNIASAMPETAAIWLKRARNG